MRKLHLPIGLVMVGLAAGELRAQPPVEATPRRSVLTITVVDPLKAVIVDAVVEVVSTDGSRVTHRTSTVGVATVSVPAGRYQVRITAVGFKPAEIAVVVGARPVARVVSLGLAEHVEVVDVVSTGTELKRDGLKDLTSWLLTREQIMSLPDDPDEMARVLRQLAGPDARIRVDGFLSSRTPTKHEIERIRIRISGFSAEFHEPQGPVVDIRTRPVASRVTGKAELGLSPAALNAESRAGSASGAPSQLQPSVSLGIPVGKSKSALFAFASWSEIRTPRVVTAVVPGEVDGTVTQERNRQTRATVRYGRDTGGGTVVRAFGDVSLGQTAGSGVGGLVVPEHGWGLRASETVVRLSASRVLNESSFAEIRFGAERATTSIEPINSGSEIIVNGAFVAGGAPTRGMRSASHVELESDWERSLGPVLLSAGWSAQFLAAENGFTGNPDGTYVFSSLGAWERSQPSAFRLKVSPTPVAVSQFRGGLYVQSQWRARSDLSIAGGLRYEAQQMVVDGFDLGPRVSVAWSPGSSGRTRIDAGFGVYHAWLDPTVVEETLLRDGEHHRELNLTDPPYPGAIPPNLVPVLPSEIYRLAGEVRKPRLTVGALSVARQVGPVTITARGEVRDGIREFRGVNVNSPDDAGDRPDKRYANVVEVTAEGRSRLRQFRCDVSGRGPFGTTVVGTYLLTSAKNDGNGAFSVPADATRPWLEWGPSGADIRHRVTGMVVAQPLRNRLWLAVNFVASSGSPYTMTTGTDANNDGLFIDRPDGVPRNSLRGGGTRSLDLHVRWRGRGVSNAADGAPRRASWVVRLDIQNLLNRSNWANFVGVLTSPAFGQPTMPGPARQVSLGFSLGFD